jgi:hypothetical protein
MQRHDVQQLQSQASASAHSAGVRTIALDEISNDTSTITLDDNSSHPEHLKCTSL